MSVPPEIREPRQTTRYGLPVPGDLDPADAPDVVGVLADAIDALLSEVLHKPGDLKWSAVEAVPAGWLRCDGAAVSRSTFADLFGAIGTSFGGGDGTSTFNVPDMRGRVPVGIGTGTGLSARALAARGGAENHQLAAAESGVREHVHHMGSLTRGGEPPLQLDLGLGDGRVGVLGATTGAPGDHALQVIAGTFHSAIYVGGVVGAAQPAQNAHNNMPPWMACAVLIKT